MIHCIFKKGKYQNKFRNQLQNRAIRSVGLGFKLAF